MLNIKYSEAITETLDILEHTKKKDVEKISFKFMEYLKENKSKTYIPNLDHTKTIKDMNLKPETKAILAVIYRKFWCDSNKKSEYDIILKQNEKEYQNILEQKYNTDKLFKNRDTIKNKDDSFEQETTYMVEYKKRNFLQKIFDRIKYFFKKI